RCAGLCPASSALAASISAVRRKSATATGPKEAVMTIIKSNHTGPLGLPRGPVVEPGKSVKVDVPGYDRFLRLHAVGSAWLAAGVIEIVSGEERATAPVPPAPPAQIGTAGDPNADLPKTAAEVLAMANEVHFQTFKAE